MKKVILFIALSLVCVSFTSCGSKNQKVAAEYLKSLMKSPSSFKVIEASENQMDARVTYDTLYHVCKIFATDLYGIRLADSVRVDSMKIMRTDYPAYTNVDITYDAANAFGAVIRDVESVVVYNEEACSFKDFVNKNGVESLDHTEVFEKTYVHHVSGNMKEGDWVDQIDLGVY